MNERNEPDVWSNKQSLSNIPASLLFRQGRFGKCRSKKPAHSSGFEKVQRRDQGRVEETEEPNTECWKTEIQQKAKTSKRRCRSKSQEANETHRMPTQIRNKAMCNSASRRVRTQALNQGAQSHSNLLKGRRIIFQRNQLSCTSQNRTRKLIVVAVGECVAVAANVYDCMQHHRTSSVRPLLSQNRVKQTTSSV